MPLVKAGRVLVCPLLPQICIFAFQITKPTSLLALHYLMSASRRSSVLETPSLRYLESAVVCVHRENG